MSSSFFPLTRIALSLLVLILADSFEATSSWSFAAPLALEHDRRDLTLGPYENTWEEVFGKGLA